MGSSRYPHAWPFRLLVLINMAVAVIVASRAYKRVGGLMGFDFSTPSDSAVVIVLVGLVVFFALLIIEAVIIGLLSDRGGKKRRRS